MGSCCRTEYNSWPRRRKWSTCNRPASGSPPLWEMRGSRKLGEERGGQQVASGLSRTVLLLRACWRSCLFFLLLPFFTEGRQAGEGERGRPIDREISFVRRVRIAKTILRFSSPIFHRFGGFLSLVLARLLYHIYIYIYILLDLGSGWDTKRKNTGQYKNIEKKKKIQQNARLLYISYLLCSIFHRMLIPA